MWNCQTFADLSVSGFGSVLAEKKKGRFVMSKEPIFVDATQGPASLQLAGIRTEYNSLGDAVAAFHRLVIEDQRRAAILTREGVIYKMDEIKRLHQERTGPGRL
jgi:hypothetical protein